MMHGCKVNRINKWLYSLEGASAAKLELEEKQRATRRRMNNDHEVWETRSLFFFFHLLLIAAIFKLLSTTDISSV